MRASGAKKQVYVHTVGVTGSKPVARTISDAIIYMKKRNCRILF